MRILRALVIAFITAVIGCVLSLPVGDYLTRLLRIPDMEGQRGMTIIFICAPLGILLGFVMGFVSSIRVRQNGAAGFFVAQGWALLATGVVAGLLAGVPYALSDKPPRIDGKRVKLEFELRVPPNVDIPTQPDGYSIRVNLLSGGRDNRFAFINWDSIKREPDYLFISGEVPLLTHSPHRTLLISVGQPEIASQMIELKIPSSPGKENEAWTDWIVSIQRADLKPIPEAERMSLRYRVRVVD